MNILTKKLKERPNSCMIIIKLQTILIKKVINHKYTVKHTTMDTVITITLGLMDIMHTQGHHQNNRVLIGK